MEAYDVVMIVLLLLATLFGAWKGLAWQIATLSSIFASYYVAYTYREPVGQMISAEPPWNKFLAMLILYIGTSLAIWLVFGLVKDVIDRVKLREFDRQIGAVIGAGTGVLVCVLVTLFSVTLLGDELKESICRSRSGYYIAMLLDRAPAMMPDEVHDVVSPYLNRLDEELQSEPSERPIQDAIEDAVEPEIPTPDSLFGEQLQRAYTERVQPAYTERFRPAPAAMP